MGLCPHAMFVHIFYDLTGKHYLHSVYIYIWTFNNSEQIWRADLERDNLREREAERAASPTTALCCWSGMTSTTL